MKDARSLRTYLERKILKHSIYVLVILSVFSIAISYGVSRIKIATDIEDSAAAVSKAYRSRILEGDIKVAQTQLHELLHLGEDEQVLILNQNKQRIYQDTAAANAKIEICPTDGQACFDYKTARILSPIYFDSEKTSLYGYVYLSRNIRVDWFFVFLTFSIFFVGYLLLYFGFSNLTRNAAGKLSNEISLWAKRLEDNPKDVATLSRAPFSESDIKSLRLLHFDEKKVLRALLRKAGDDGDLPSEIKKVLREHLGISDSSKRRISKGTLDLSTEKSVDN